MFSFIDPLTFTAKGVSAALRNHDKRPAIAISVDTCPDPDKSDQLQSIAAIQIGQEVVLVDIRHGKGEYVDELLLDTDRYSTQSYDPNHDKLSFTGEPIADYLKYAIILQLIYDITLKAVNETFSANDEVFEDLFTIYTRCYAQIKPVLVSVEEADEQTKLLANFLERYITTTMYLPVYCDKAAYWRDLAQVMGLNKMVGKFQYDTISHVTKVANYIKSMPVSQFCPRIDLADPKEQFAYFRRGTDVIDAIAPHVDSLIYEPDIVDDLLETVIHVEDDNNGLIRLETALKWLSVFKDDNIVMLSIALRSGKVQKYFDKHGTLSTASKDVFEWQAGLNLPFKSS